MQTDVVLTLIVLTFATIPFYMLGAGVLNRMGQMPDGLDTLSILSNMYTQTLGQWAWWLFMFRRIFCTVFNGGLRTRRWFTNDGRCNGRYWCD